MCNFLCFCIVTGCSQINGSRPNNMTSVARPLLAILLILVVFLHYAIPSPSTDVTGSCFQQDSGHGVTNQEAQLLNHSQDFHQPPAMLHNENTYFGEKEHFEALDTPEEEIKKQNSGQAGHIKFPVKEPMLSSWGKFYYGLLTLVIATS